MRCLTPAAWGDYIERYNFGTIPPNKVVLHHTVSPTIQSWKGLKSMIGMQTYYRGMGWVSAPHIYVAPDGIWLATPMYDVGTHANECNATYKNGKLIGYSIGVEMVGNYDEEKPSGVIWQLTKDVLGRLVDGLDLSITEDILFHRDCNSSKTCPGRAVTKEWVRGELFDWMGRDPIGSQLQRYYVGIIKLQSIIYTGPGETFQPAGVLSPGTVLVIDAFTTPEWAHMARVGPYQYDLGFVPVGNLTLLK